MIFAYIFLFILFLLDCKPHYFRNGINKNYLSKNETLPIKGIFVILVFFRHFRSYVDMDHGLLNHLFVMLDSRSSQLIVTMFFFYSGYGILEQLNKNKNYISSFISHRFVPTYISFFVCVFIYFMISLTNGKSFSPLDIFLCFLGWNDSFGNSNWFMLVTFALYIIFYISFSFKRKMDDRKHLFYKLSIFNILTLFLILLLAKYKKHYWYNTLLCFNIGMWFSYFREKIEFFFNKNNKNFFILFLIIAVAFLCSFFLIETQSPLFIIKALLFSVMIVMFQTKISLQKSIIFNHLGNHVFSFYMLQRIQFMIFKNLKFDSNIYVFFILTFIFTVIISLGYDYIFNGIKSFICNRIQKTNS